MQVRFEDVSPVEKKMFVEIPWDTVSAKLGEAFSARGIAPHVFERREEAQAFLAGRSGDAGRSN